MVEKVERFPRHRPAWSTRQAAGQKEVKQIGLRRSLVKRRGLRQFAKFASFSYGPSQRPGLGRQNLR
jgi:hypothetical protein